MTAVLAPLQLIIGDQHGLNTLEHQPAKIAAIEGHWDGSKPGELRIFRLARREDREQPLSDRHPACLVADPDPQLERTVPGLKDVPPQDRPPLANVFFGFRIMLGLGIYMIAAAAFTAPGCCGAAGCLRRAGI